MLALRLWEPLRLAPRGTFFGVKNDAPGLRWSLNSASGETRAKLAPGTDDAVFAGTQGGIVAIMPVTRDVDEVEDAVVLLDGTDGQVRAKVTSHFQLHALAVSPDRRLVAVAGDEQVVLILDAATLAEKFRFRAHDASITALTFHPTQPILATASTDFSIKLWDYAAAQVRESFLGLNGRPVMLAFSPNGRLLAAEGQEKSFRIFDTSGDGGRTVTPAPSPVVATDAGGWADLLATLTPEAVAQSGSGWRMENGALFSPQKAWATLPLPGKLNATSYQVRVKLRQLPGPKDVFHLILPVANRMVGFDLDGFPQAEFYTGLVRVNGQAAGNLPGAVHGNVVKDSEPHDLKVTVRLDGDNATVSVQFDDRPLYEWTGSTAALSLDPGWRTTPRGTLALGAFAADWVVHEVKVKRQEK